jgi:hypothetical protein
LCNAVAQITRFIIEAKEIQPVEKAPYTSVSNILCSTSSIPPERDTSATIFVPRMIMVDCMHGMVEEMALVSMRILQCLRHLPLG